MKNFYIFPCLLQLGGKTRVTLMTFAIMFFTIAFAQAQEAVRLNQNVSMAKEQELSAQRINSERMQNVNGQPVEGLPISIKNAGSRSAASMLDEGFGAKTLSATGACGKGAESTNINTQYGNLINYTFADDFVVLPNENFYFEQMEFIFLLQYEKTPSQLFLNFYEDSVGNGPGTEISYSLEGGSVEFEFLGEYYNSLNQLTDLDIMLVTVTLGTPINFQGGAGGASYWAGVKIGHNGGANDARAIGTDISDSQTFYVNPGSGWVKSTDGYQGVPPQDLIMGFYGQCEDVPVYVYENGIWTPENPSGITTNENDIIVVNGTVGLTADTHVNNLTVQAGATLEINNVLNLYGDLTIDGDLIFVSNENGNGELGTVSASSNITGDATVQNYMSHNRSYRMVSSSVTTTTSVHDNWQEGAISNSDNPAPGFGTHITGSTTDQLNGFDGTATGNPSMFTVVGQAFEAVSNTDDTALEAGIPYLLFVRGDRSIDLTGNEAAGETVLRAKGSLHTGSQSQDFDMVDMGEFAMFGNPYQSAVDINSVFANSTNINTNFYYVYDPTLGVHGAYVTVDLASGSALGSDANQYLQPGQGAQFAASGVGATINFAETDKAPGNFTMTSATDNGMTDNMLIAQLYTIDNLNNGGPVHDSFGIIFAEGNDNGITPEDAVKPMNFYENIARDHGGTYLSLERRAMPQPAEVLPLYSSGYSYSNYALKMIIAGLEETSFYLDDHFTGTTTLLGSGETIYAFDVDANDELSIATDRFLLRTEAYLGVADTETLAGIRLYPNPLSDGTFYIHAPKLKGEQVEVNITDMAGRQMFNDTVDAQDNKIAVSVNGNLTSGVYLVKLRYGGEEQTYRLVKQ